MAAAGLNIREIAAAVTSPARRLHALLPVGRCGTPASLQNDLASALSVVLIRGAIGTVYARALSTSFTLWSYARTHARI
jgi:hypothetical protein